MNAPEHIASETVDLKPKNTPEEVVENFRRDIETWFVRYQTFYDRSNAAMRSYRMAHVTLVTRIYNEFMTVYGDDIEVVRQSAYELLDLIELRQGELGEDNACITGVVQGHGRNSIQVSTTIQNCAIYANTTMERMLINVFYPAFADIQSLISTVPNAVIDVLSRGNVLQDEEAIIEFLRARFEVIEIQWLGAVSQLLRWESNRFETDGLFLVDQSTICMAAAVLQYIGTNARLEQEARAC